jgi:DNA-binding NarL/FixJ family response regulator
MVRSSLVLVSDESPAAEPAGRPGGTTANDSQTGVADGAEPTGPGPRRPIGILVVEDHRLVREGTAELLERDPMLTVVGQAASAEQALDLIGALSPDVALVDVELPGMNGIALAREIAARSARTKVLVLSAYDDYAYVIGALEAGVAGYLLKTSSARELADAVRTAAGGALVLDESISRRLTRRWRSGLDSAPVALTARESEVLALIAQGMSNKQIASALALGLRTVESHVSSMLGKLGLGSRTEAALYAVSHHLTQPGSRGRPG